MNNVQKEESIVRRTNTTPGDSITSIMPVLTSNTPVISMTVQELADFLGKSQNTIRRAATDAGLTSENGIVRRYDRGEVEIIVSVIYKSGKIPSSVRSAIEYTFSGTDVPAFQNVKVVPCSPGKVAEEEKITITAAERLFKTMISEIAPLLSGTTTATAPVAITYGVTPPDMSIRDMVRAKVNEYAISSGKDNHTAWRDLYSLYDIIYHCSVGTLSENRGLSKLDYIDQSGKLPELIGIAERYLLGRGNVQ